jgi:hypothetical protein
MKKAKWKIGLYITLTIILLIAVFFTGWYVGFRKGLMAGGLSSSMSEFMLFNIHIKDQMENATCEDLKKSLHEYLTMLDKHKNTEYSVLTNTSYYGDLMLSHVRLAQIENKMGNDAEMKNHINFALEACKKRGWKECNEDKLREFISGFDEKISIKCLNER